MRHPRGFIAFALTLALAFVACALFPAARLEAQAAPVERPHRPKIGLALGGGGARGFAHVGVLKELEALHIPIDYIAGTSMGSVVGGLYACGYSPAAIEDIVKRIPWDTLFTDAPPRAQLSFRNKEDDFLHLLPIQLGLKKSGIGLPSGLVAGSKLSFILQSVLLSADAAPDFDHLRIPFRAVAADIQTGEVVVLSKGSLSRSVRASMAIPAAFTPVEIDGRLLIDGGMAQNLPVQTVRAMGADFVIAIDVGSSGEASPKPENVADMLSSMIDIPLKQNTTASRALGDVVIQPDLKGISSAAFLRYPEIIPRGEVAAKKAAPDLEKLSIPQAEFDAWLAAKQAPLPPPPVIDAVQVADVPGFDGRRLAGLIHSRPGVPLDFKILGQDLKRIYALGVFTLVGYDVVVEDGRHILRFMAYPKTWGPTFLRPGLGLQSDVAGDAQFDVLAQIDATEMNRLGGRWKTLVDLGSNLGIRSIFYQPVEPTGRFSVAPYVGWDQNLVNIYNADAARVAQYIVREFRGGLDLVADFGTWGELRFGYEGGTAKAKLKVGNPVFPDLSASNGELHASAIVDQVDNVNFPKEGYYGRIAFRMPRESLGADSSYETLSGGFLGAQTVGRFTGTLLFKGADSLKTNLPFYDQFTLGGLFNLSGRPLNQLNGQTQLFGAGVLAYRLNESSGAFIHNLYAGVSLEVGNVWNTRRAVTLSGVPTAGSVFVTVDSLVGPLYLAYGHSSGGFSAFYFYLNRSLGGAGAHN